MSQEHSAVTEANTEVLLSEELEAKFKQILGRVDETVLEDPEVFHPFYLSVMRTDEMTLNTLSKQEFKENGTIDLESTQPKVMTLVETADGVITSPVSDSFDPEKMLDEFAAHMSEVQGE